MNIAEYRPFVNLSIITKRRPKGRRFVLQAELAHEVVVGLRVFTLEVFHQAAAFAHLLDQPAAGGVVLLVHLQVFDQLVDFGAEEGDLDLRRTGVVGMGLELLDQLLLLIGVQHRGGGGRTIVCSGFRKGRTHHRVHAPDRIPSGRSRR